MQKIIDSYIKVVKRFAKRKDGKLYNHHRWLLKIFYSKKPFEGFNKILWKDGFHYTGEVMDQDSNKGDSGQGVTYYQIYNKGIKPYVNKDTVVLEIGPGRGSWTKALLKAKEVWAMDAQDLKRNKILDYLSYPSNLKYIAVKNFDCKDLPDEYFDFVFSYGCFCHIPWDGIVAYIENLYKKVKVGAICMIHISDEIKNPDNINYRKWYPGCFVPNSAAKMNSLLDKAGWKVIDPDFLSCKRDSIILFKK